MAIFNEAYIEEITRLEKEEIARFEKSVSNKKRDDAYKKYFASMDTKKLKNEYRLYRNDARINRETSRANDNNFTLAKSRRSVEDKACADRRGHQGGLIGRELAKRGVDIKELNNKIDSIGKKTI